MSLNVLLDRATSKMRVNCKILATADFEVAIRDYGWFGRKNLNLSYHIGYDCPPCDRIDI